MEEYCLCKEFQHVQVYNNLNRILYGIHLFSYKDWLFEGIVFYSTLFLYAQEVSTAVPKLTRESSGQYSDFSILSSLNSQVSKSTMVPFDSISHISWLEWAWILFLGIFCFHFLFSRVLPVFQNRETNHLSIFLFFFGGKLLLIPTFHWLWVFEDVTKYPNTQIVIFLLLRGCLALKWW